MDEIFSGSIVNDIGYLKFMPQSDYYQITSQPQITEYCMEKVSDNGYFKEIVKQVPINNSLWFLWGDETQHPQIQKYKEYGACNGGVLYIRNGKNLNSIQFTTNKAIDFNTASNFYINNKKELEKISFYLLNKIELFLNSKNGVPMGKFEEGFDYSFTPKNQDHSSNAEFQTNYQNFSRRYIVGDKEVILSPKQNECLSLLAKGLSNKEIAKVLRVSPRTIETHIKEIKVKMDVCFKSDLIKAYQLNTHSNLF